MQQGTQVYLLAVSNVFGPPASRNGSAKGTVERLSCVGGSRTSSAQSAATDQMMGPARATKSAPGPGWPSTRGHGIRRDLLRRSEPNREWHRVPARLTLR